MEEGRERALRARDHTVSARESVAGGKVKVRNPITSAAPSITTLHGCLCACVKNNRIFPLYHIINARGEYSGERIRRSV